MSSRCDRKRVPRCLLLRRCDTESVCPAASCCADVTLTCAPAHHAQKSQGSWLGEGKEPWLQLWDAGDLRRFLHDFGDEWCRQCLDKAHGTGRQYQLAQPARSQAQAETVRDSIGKENQKSNPGRGAVRGDATASGPAQMKMGSGGMYASDWMGGPKVCRSPGRSCPHSNSGRACVGEDGGIGQDAGESGPLSTPAGHFDGRNGERSSKKIRFDWKEDFEIYCFLRKELTPAGQGHQTKLPPRITKSRVLQNLLDHFPGSRSSRNVRSERSLRDHVNNFILKNEVRLEEFDAEYKRRGTLTYDEMMRDVD